jgi:hypothetical protein
MFRHLQEDAVSGTPTGERARSGGSAQADNSVARPAPAGADSTNLRLSAFRFLLFLSFFCVGWVERSETHRSVHNDDGFRCAQPILRFHVSLAACGKKHASLFEIVSETSTRARRGYGALRLSPPYEACLNASLTRSPDCAACRRGRGRPQIRCARGRSARLRRWRSASTVKWFRR